MNCVCIALTKSYLIGFKALVNSIIKHTPDFNEHIVCLDIDLDKSHQDECKKIYKNVSFVNPDKSNYVKLPRHAPALKNAFFKLDVFNIAKNYDKLLFVDSDIIFVESIRPLLDTKIDKDLGIVYHAEYSEYNTGLMLLSRSNDGRYKSLIKVMKLMRESHLGDQTVINKAIKSNVISIKKLSRKWNVTKRQIVRSGRSHIGIHFVGKKPFKGGEGGEYKKLEDLWWSYANMR